MAGVKTLVRSPVQPSWRTTHVARYSQKRGPAHLGKCKLSWTFIPALAAPEPLDLPHSSPAAGFEATGRASLARLSRLTSAKMVPLSSRPVGKQGLTASAQGLGCSKWRFNPAFPRQMRLAVAVGTFASASQQRHAHIMKQLG